MRSMVDAQDYRYFPDPDLVAARNLRKLDFGRRDSITRVARAGSCLDRRPVDFSSYDVETLTADREIAGLFCSGCQHLPPTLGCAPTG